MHPVEIFDKLTNIKCISLFSLSPNIIYRVLYNLIQTYSNSLLFSACGMGWHGRTDRRAESVDISASLMFNCSGIINHHMHYTLTERELNIESYTLHNTSYTYYLTIRILPQCWFGFGVYLLYAKNIRENGINNQVIGLFFLSFAPTNHINSLLTTIFRNDAMLFLTPCLLFLIGICFRVVAIYFLFYFYFF